MVIPSSITQYYFTFIIFVVFIIVSTNTLDFHLSFAEQEVKDAKDNRVRENLDLAVANSLSKVVSILLGNGDGTFGNSTEFAVGDKPGSVATGDFNSDNNTDLAVANAYSGDVSILLGKGDGTFGNSTEFAVGDVPISIVADDFNSDNIPDLALANRDSNDTSILLGKGDGTFGNSTEFAVGSSPSYVAVGDFNSDNHTDLALPNYLHYSGMSIGDSDNGNVSILLGNGDGTFGSQTDFSVGDFSSN